ncbi:MAG: carboxylate-amine ligase [Sulfuricella sp.]|nr:glutamate-cysteine ligase family protein [Gammaproteobacteria bacterium]
MNVGLHAFAGYGIELEYMIVDRQTLSVLPLADKLLFQEAGACTPEVKRGMLAWSNELVLHLVELKNPDPSPALEILAGAFQSEAERINRALEPMGAQLMPTAMHPWMDPVAETRLWPHDNAAIYQTYDRIFDCKRHGWANLQSMHVNLPFAGDAEFERLHAAVRLVLPILPALAASSPIAEGRPAGPMDFRMESYRMHPLRIPSIIGRVIPETVRSRAEYESNILVPMYRDIAPLDPEGVLHHEWLNARGAIPRFDRGAIEIRVIDMQECPRADLAIAAISTAIVRALYDAGLATLEAQQEIGTEALAEILLACIRDADLAVIDNAAYLQLLGFPGRCCQAGELWRHLDATMSQGSPGLPQIWRDPLHLILQHGPLSRRILRALGPEWTESGRREVYRDLCACLEEGRMFQGLQ